MPKLIVSLSIGISNATQKDEIEVPQEEVDACKTQEDFDKLKEDYWKYWADNYIDGGAWFEDEL